MTALKDMKRLELSIVGVLRRQDVSDLPAAVQKLVAELKRAIVDLRLDIRDAEYAETAEEYKRFVKQAKQRTDVVSKTILVLSQDNIFGAVEVAELTAQLQLVTGVL